MTEEELKNWYKQFPFIDPQDVSYENGLLYHHAKQWENIYQLFKSRLMAELKMEGK